MKFRAAKLLWICSTAFLSACAGMPKFPSKDLIEYDAKLFVCRHYRIVKFDPFQFDGGEIIKCPSVFGFTSTDVPKVLDYIDAATAYGKANCRK